MSEPTSTDQADAQGYTRQVIIDGEDYPVGLGAFIKPHTDISGIFKAFDSDDQRMVTIDGSKVAVRDIG